MKTRYAKTNPIDGVWCPVIFYYEDSGFNFELIHADIVVAGQSIHFPFITRDVTDIWGDALSAESRNRIWIDMHTTGMFQNLAVEPTTAGKPALVYVVFELKWPRLSDRVMEGYLTYPYKGGDAGM